MKLLLLISILLILSSVSGRRTSATDCGKGFFWNSFACQVCVHGCEECSDATSCSKCVNLFEVYQTEFSSWTQQWDMNTGTAYNTLKQSCNIIDSETETYEFQVLSYARIGCAGGLCFQGCKNLCTSYNGYLFCTECQAGYLLIGTDCVKCYEDGCTICTSQAEATCTQCASGYVLDSHGICLPCPSHCTECSVSSDGSMTECKKCESFYNGNEEDPSGMTDPWDGKGLQSLQANAYQRGTVLAGKQCVVCPGHCEACVSAAECTVCADTYYLDSTTKLCVLCDGGDFCDVSTIKFACVSSEAFESAGTCVATVSGCSSYDATGCATCKEPGLSGVACATVQNSVYKCLTAGTGEVCLNCQEGYYADATGLCVSCTGYDDYCASCNATVCTACTAGYFYSHGNCVECGNVTGSYISGADFCLACSLDGLCTECQRGYYVNTAGSCIACSSDCEVCDCGSTCQTCKPGFMLTDAGICTKATSCQYHDAETDKCLLCDINTGSLDHKLKYFDDQDAGAGGVGGVDIADWHACYPCGTRVKVQDFTDVENDVYLYVPCEPICAADYVEEVAALNLGYTLMLFLSIILMII